MWQSIPVERAIKFDNITFTEEKSKISYLYSKPNNDVDITVKQNDEIISKGLKDIFRNKINDKKSDYASLSVNVQISRDSRQINDKKILFTGEL